MVEIKQASDNMQYEKAAYLRDKKLAIEAITEKQKVSNISENDIDVIGIARNEFKICIEIFFVRKSKMLGREHYFLENMNDEPDEEILSSFIKQYYIGTPFVPHQILVQEEVEEPELLSQMLSRNKNYSVQIVNPKKGQKEKLVELAAKNARSLLEQNKESCHRQNIKFHLLLYIHHWLPAGRIL